MDVYLAKDTSAYAGYIRRGKPFTILAQEDGWARIGGPNGEDPGDPHWIRVSTTAYAAVDHRPDMVTTGHVDAYSLPDVVTGAFIDPGHTFRISEVRDDWLRIKMIVPGGAGAEGWIRMDSAFLPVGEPTPVPTRPPRPFPLQIGNMESDGLVIHNLSGRLGLWGVDWGWRDQDGKLCPDGGGNIPCEGKVGCSSGMAQDNVEFVFAMFKKYADGRKLEIFVRDDAPEHVPLGADHPEWTKYAAVVDGVMQLHYVLKPSFDASNPERRFNFGGVVDGEIWSFLVVHRFVGEDEYLASMLRDQPISLHILPVPGQMAIDLTALDAPRKLELKEWR